MLHVGQNLRQQHPRGIDTLPQVWVLVLGAWAGLWPDPDLHAATNIDEQLQRPTFDQDLVFKVGGDNLLALLETRAGHLPITGHASATALLVSAVFRRYGGPSLGHKGGPQSEHTDC